MIYAIMNNVELDQKRKHIMRCIKLGMDLTSSMIVAQCTPTEIELLEADDRFHREVQFRQHILEMELLERHKNGRDLAASKGMTRPVEWMLEKVNKDRWSGKGNDMPFNIQNAVIYLPEKK